jgi:Protein of unknown function (DUF5661)
VPSPTTRSQSRRSPRALSRPVVTGKIDLAHLNEFPDYYTRLATMEAEAEAYWRDRQSHS